MRLIQITNKYQGRVLDIVRSCVPEGFRIRVLPEVSIEALKENIVDADYLIASGRLYIDDEILSQANNLKMIQRTGVGLDSLNIAHIVRKGLPLYVNQGVNAISVAEHTLLLIIACLRRLCIINQNTKAGLWSKQEQGVQTYELNGKTVGIVGMGSIGQRLVKLLQGFGVKLLYYDMFRLPEEMEKALGLKYSTMDELMTSSDIISLHCPLTAETAGMINEASLNLMKDGVVIINTARGGLINETDLEKAILNGKVSFAGLDVHAEEPISKQNRLVNLDRVIATPHIGGVTYDSFYRMMQEAMRNIYYFDMNQLYEIEEYKYRIGDQIS